MQSDVLPDFSEGFVSGSLFRNSSTFESWSLRSSRSLNAYRFSAKSVNNADKPPNEVL